MSAPGRGGRKYANGHASSSTRTVGLSNLNPASSTVKGGINPEEVDEVLFDEDEGSGKGIDESGVSASGSGSGESPDEDRVPFIGAQSSTRGRKSGRAGGSRV